MAGQIRLPSSSGGIMQYYDEYKSKIKISPIAILVATAIVMLIVIILHKIDPLGTVNAATSAAAAFP